MQKPETYESAPPMPIFNSEDNSECRNIVNGYYMDA